MTGPETSASAARRLREVLLHYLEAAGVCPWPGCDGMCLEDAVDAYPEAVAAGRVPDWGQLLREHPDLEEELQTWLVLKDRWQFAFRHQPVARARSLHSRRHDGGRERGADS